MVKSPPGGDDGGVVGEVGAVDLVGFGFVVVFELVGAAGGAVRQGAEELVFADDGSFLQSIL